MSTERDVALKLMGVLTPVEFEEAMKEIVAEHVGDSEAAHANIDDLMMRLLEALGYGEGLKQVDNVDMWYA